MITNHLQSRSLCLQDIAICDFSSLNRLTNKDVLQQLGKKNDGRLLGFIEQSMGIEARHWCSQSQNSLDLARSAITELVERNPDMREQVDFLIFAGISNPYPVTTLSALLADEFGFFNASCWDLKSGCSTALLALQQGIALLNSGAKAGIIVSAENLSRFSNPEILQMSMAIGDGAAALYITQGDEWLVKSSVHGTDSAFSSYMRVHGEFPVKEDAVPEDYYFTFANKPEGIQRLAHHWQTSLAELLRLADLQGEQIQHYVAHQVDEQKNLAVALAAKIPCEKVALNFRQFGNMGSPTIFVNLHDWLAKQPVRTDDHLVLHAVGGGISWAGICLQRQP